jgi:hypothetical protein
MIVRTLVMSFCALALLPSLTLHAAEPKTREFKAQELVLQIPTTWVEKPASNNLRLAQFEIPAAEGDKEPGELVIFPPFGGSIAENIRRWVGQFESEGLKSEFSKGKAAQGEYVIADLSGTYKKPDGPPIRGKTISTPGYRVVSVILTTEKEGNYFLKLVGPEKTIDAAMESFRKSFGADKSKEEKLDF